MNFDFLRWLRPSQEAARRTAIFSEEAGAVEKRAHKTTTLTPTCKRIKDSEDVIHFSWTTRQVPLHQAQSGQRDEKSFITSLQATQKRKGSRESCFAAFFEHHTTKQTQNAKNAHLCPTRQLSNTMQTSTGKNHRRKPKLAQKPTGSTIPTLSSSN